MATRASISSTAIRISSATSWRSTGLLYVSDFCPGLLALSDSAWRSTGLLYVSDFCPGLLTLPDFSWRSTGLLYVSDFCPGLLALPDSAWRSTGHMYRTFVLDFWHYRTPRGVLPDSCMYRTFVLDSWDSRTSRGVLPDWSRPLPASRVRRGVRRRTSVLRHPVGPRRRLLLRGVPRPAERVLGEHYRVAARLTFETYC